VIGEKLLSYRVSKPSIFYITFLPLKKPKAIMVCIDSFKLQTMIVFNQKFLRGSRGHASCFFKKSPLAAGGRNGTCVFLGIVVKILSLKEKQRRYHGINRRTGDWFFFLKERFKDLSRCEPG
jgi:hypothetical protein